MAQDRVLIIAEAGVNHNGSLEQAMALVDVAADAGADIVKFQIFNADTLVTETAPKADYQIETTGKEKSQYEMLKALELSQQDHIDLKARCDKKGIQFLSTPFDEVSARFLTDEMNLPMMKIGSGELTNAPLLLEISQKKLKIILSTGMAEIPEIKEALGVIAFGLLGGTQTPNTAEFEKAFSSEEGKHALQEKVTVLHCTTEYPTPPKDVNLRAMELLREELNLPIGYSDHTQGIQASIIAVAAGATVIEKHFTQDRSLPGPDHRASIEPRELKLMIQGIRGVEVLLGEKKKVPTAGELENRKVARKSLVASRAIKQGEKFSADDFSVKRPGTGLAPSRYWDLIGKEASKNYEKDELIQS